MIQGVDGVVAGFGVDVGLKLLDFINEAWTVKNDDTIYATERGETIGTLDFRLDGSRWPFEGTHTFVTVDQDPELIGECARFLQIGDVPHVQQVEATIGHNH